MNSDNSVNALHLFPRDKQSGLSSAAMMRHVCYALIPGIILQTFYVGLSVPTQIVLAIMAAVICETIVAVLRRRRLTALDVCTGLLTAMLLAVSVPATSPWWLIVTAVSFGLVLGKHIFGGVGMNIFNPALVGFCAVYLSFPAEISHWPQSYINVSDGFVMIFQSTGDKPLDNLTGATLLASLKANGLTSIHSNTHWFINAAWLIGGIYLWLRKIADWRLSIYFVIGFIALTVVFNAFRGSEISTVQHIGLGALIFTTCFIITDPTTAATSPFGRLIYALLAALLAVIIRQYSNMPDSMAFAVLLANMAAPMIDNYTRPQYVKST